MYETTPLKGWRSRVTGGEVEKNDGDNQTVHDLSPGR